MNRSPLTTIDLLEAKGALQDIGALFYDFGWSLGTSSNYSLVLSRQPLRLLITASGKDKSQLQEEDFVIVDENGKTSDTATGKPSAETMLHVILAQLPGVGAVLHTHSVWGTLLSDRHHKQGGFFIEGYEMLKGLEGIKTHEHREWIQIFENSQDIPDLSRRVKAFLNTDAQGQTAHGFLIHRHGLYTWGKDLDEARRHVEILEFLFEVVGRSQ